LCIDEPWYTPLQKPATAVRPTSPAQVGQQSRVNAGDYEFPDDRRKDIL